MAKMMRRNLKRGASEDWPNEGRHQGRAAENREWMTKRSDEEYAEMSRAVEAGEYTVRLREWLDAEAQYEYDTSPELQDLLTRAAASPTVHRMRRPRRS